MNQSLIVIPARMKATRLPGKPMKDICGEPMIVHVWRQACRADAGRVVVATDDEEILGAVRAAGGEAVMTRADHVSGSDRVFEAINHIDPEAGAEFIVNLQGDLPTLEPALIRACVKLLEEPHTQIGTLAAKITDEGEVENPNVVKIVGSPYAKDGRSLLRALYFTRAPAPAGDGPHYHHIGIYAYRRSALERFVSLPPSALEKRERLEQLRALEDGMRVDVAVVDTVPVGVDTPADLERVRRLIGGS